MIVVRAGFAWKRKVFVIRTNCPGGSYVYTLKRLSHSPFLQWEWTGQKLKTDNTKKYYVYQVDHVI